MVELLISSALFCALGLIIYGVASEGLFAFSRNVSINRSYLEARRSLDRIGLALQTAGSTPVLTNATGATVSTTPAAGIRFWSCNGYPVYDITITPALTDKTLTISLAPPGSTGSSQVNQSAPLVGDLITVPALGFQGLVTGVTSTSNSAVLTFANTVAANSPTSLASIPKTVGSNGTGATIQYACLDWQPVAFIVVGTQLRYYPRFTYGTTSLNTASNYQVLTNLLPAVPSQEYTVSLSSTNGVTTTPALPFSLGPTPSVNVGLYAQAPDYNNRTRDIGSANTYTYLQAAFSPRNAGMLSSPP